MWTLNWIICEPIWKRRRFCSNINEPIGCLTFRTLPTYGLFSFKKPNATYHKIRPFILRHTSYPVSYKLCCTGAAACVVHKHQTEVKRHVRTGLVVLHRLHQRVVVDLHHHESTQVGQSFTRTVNVIAFCEQELFLKFFWRTSVLFVGPPIALFWTSGDVCPGFQS